MTPPPAPPASLPLPPWPHCDDPASCRGRRVDPHPKCLVHLDPAVRAAYLAGLAPGANFDHRGTTLSAADLADILNAVRDPATARPRLGDVRFDGATFADTAVFEQATFTSVAWFSEATFEKGADFSGVIFSGDVWFDGVAFHSAVGFNTTTFARTAGFSGATFTGAVGYGRATFAAAAEFAGTTIANAYFRNATFTGDTWFSDATFTGETNFTSATFGADADFSRVTVADDASFNGVTFTGKASFDRATFAGYAGFYAVKFLNRVRFLKATFTGEPQLGPFVCVGEVSFADAVFRTPVTIEVAAAQVVCCRTRWEQTATVRLRYADLDLTGAVLTQPLAVAAHPEPFPGTGTADALLLGGAPQAARVTSLRGVDAAFLSLTDTDLSRCRFAGTFHLDQLRLEGRTVFAAPPTGTRWRYGSARRWTRRRTLAEEHAWHALDEPPAHPAAPTGAEWRPGPDHPNRALTPGPDGLAPLYRALRKSFEDGKNEPGAADFYYGEMSMRRHDRIDTSRAERALLTVYWALSGYGLRASRALAWLGLAMTATILAMMLWGLPTHDPEPHTTGTQVAPGQRVDWVTENPDPELHGAYSSRFTAKRTEKAARVVVNSVVFRSSGQNLTTAGTYIEMASRFAEPVLLALAALAIRGRVKR